MSLGHGHIRVDDHPRLWPGLSAAAAEAKAVLLELAAESLKVPQSQLGGQRRGDLLTLKNNEHRVTYGQLAKDKKSKGTSAANRR